MIKKRFQIRGMHCVACAMTIDGAIEDLHDVQAADTNYAHQYVSVEYDAEKLSEREIIQAIETAGYEVVS